MATFEINGKEFELKITYKAAQYLNKVVEGGTMGVIGKAISGDLESFPHIIHAALFHHKQNFSYSEVEEEIAKGFDEEKFDAAYVFEVGSEVVADSFFYKNLTEKLLAESPEAAEQLKKLIAKN